jgi:Uma2 family endonuclease
MEDLASIREGLAQADAGNARPAQEVFAGLRQKHGRLEHRAMATVPGPSEQRTILHNVSWETYESLVADHRETSSPRFTYDRGTLEILSPSTKHERLNRRLATLVETVADEWGIDYDNVGSNTFTREDLKRGFEPDSCFYIQNVERVIDKEQIDLSVDPPPDLVLEIDITSPSLDKLPIYAQVGVPEVWRHDGRRVAIYRLEGESYTEQDESAALPGLTTAVISHFLQRSETQKRSTWLRSLREWARRPGSAS